MQNNVCRYLSVYILVLINEQDHYSLRLSTVAGVRGSNMPGWGSATKSVQFYLRYCTSRACQGNAKFNRVDQRPKRDRYFVAPLKSTADTHRNIFLIKNDFRDGSRGADCFYEHFV